tara:strand:- start:150 stop:443 length:294 start_codon:yes stop_codon:yes gene_type:complete
MANFVLAESETNQLVSDADYRQQYYGTMQMCASAIEEIINNNSVTISQEELNNLDDDFKHEIVNNHVSYLQTMVSQDFWTSEDMTAVNSAITNGNAY